MPLQAATPVTNPREAFCCKGCRDRFYRLRYVREEKKTSPRRAFSLRLIEKAVVKKRGVRHRCACNRFAAADLKRVTSGGSSLGNAFPPNSYGVPHLKSS